MPDTTLTCPKCDKPMRALTVGDSTVDRCEVCFGVFLDADERLMAVDKKIADVIDIAPESVGKEFDKITDIDCPRCGEHMQHRKHPDQKHIGFEECLKCEGRFFDAGEMRDLSRLSLGDVIRGLLGR